MSCAVYLQHNILLTVSNCPSISYTSLSLQIEHELCTRYILVRLLVPYYTDIEFAVGNGLGRENVDKFKGCKR